MHLANARAAALSLLGILVVSACGGGQSPVKTRPEVATSEARDAGRDPAVMEADSGATAASKPPCGVDAVDAFRCTDPRDDAPACAKTLDEQQARRAIDRGPANDVREFCRRDLEIPPHELDHALLRKLRSVGAADDSDELCCYSACVPLDVAPAPVDAPRGGITLCIGAPESTSQPAAAYPECPAALRSRTFRDTGVLDVAQTGAERAGTADPRLSSKATARPCCYDFPRNVQVGP